MNDKKTDQTQVPQPMSLQAAEAAVQFMRRAELKGIEVDAYNLVMAELQEQIRQAKR